MPSLVQAAVVAAVLETLPATLVLAGTDQSMAAVAAAGDAADGYQEHLDRPTRRARAETEAKELSF
jgi:hypothetical protein